MKNKDWERGRGGLINFPPLKRGGLFEKGGLLEDVRYLCRIKKSTVLQISGLNEKTGINSGLKCKMQLIQSNSFQA